MTTSSEPFVTNTCIAYDGPTSSVKLTLSRSKVVRKSCVNKLTFVKFNFEQMYTERYSLILIAT